MQLKALRQLVEKFPEWKRQIKLVMIGGCRDVEDEKRLDSLKKLAQELDLQEIVEFKSNLPYGEMKEYLRKALIGLHTMWNEHFGIGIVEYMAAAVIPVAHQSGGPKLDIVIPYNHELTGYTATTAESYAEAMHKILSMPVEDAHLIQQRARDSVVQRFSDESFKGQILELLSSPRFPLLSSIFADGSIK